MSAVICNAQEVEFLAMWSQLPPQEQDRLRTRMLAMTGPVTNADLHDAKARLYEAASSLEILAEAASSIGNEEFPGAYGACYAIKRLVVDAVATIERVKLP